MDGTSDDEDEDLSRELRQYVDDLRMADVRILFSSLVSFIYLTDQYYCLQERQTLAVKNERLQSQLRSLKEDLANTRDDQVGSFCVIKASV